MKKTKITALLLSLAMLSSAAMPGTLAIESAADGSAEYVCGMIAHTHDETCYEDNLVCTEEVSEGHKHSVENGCYEIVTETVCGIEFDEHEHSDECEEGCEIKIEHVHGEDCASEEVQTLICEEPESEGHTHGDGCYSEPVLVCTTKEHTHDESCLPEPEVCDSCGMEVDSCICCEFCDGTTDAHDEDCELYVCPDCNVTGGHADDCITLCTCEPVDGVHLEGCKFYEVPAVYCEQCYNILEECACCTDCGVMAEEVHLNTCVNYEQGTSAEYIALCETVVTEAQVVLASLELLENPEEGVIYDFTAESLLEQVSAIWTQIDDAETSGTVTQEELTMLDEVLATNGIDLWDIEERLNRLIEAEITEEEEEEIIEEEIPELDESVFEVEIWSDDTYVSYDIADAEKAHALEGVGISENEYTSFGGRDIWRMETGGERFESWSGLFDIDANSEAEIMVAGLPEVGTEIVEVRHYLDTVEAIEQADRNGNIHTYTAKGLGELFPAEVQAAYEYAGLEETICYELFSTEDDTVILNEDGSICFRAVSYSYYEMSVIFEAPVPYLLSANSDNPELNKAAIHTHKTVLYNEESGEYTLQLESYVTGEEVEVITNTTVPTDFVLSIDISHSMPPCINCGASGIDAVGTGEHGAHSHCEVWAEDLDESQMYYRNENETNSVYYCGDCGSWYSEAHTFESHDGTEYIPKYSNGNTYRRQFYTQDKNENCGDNCTHKTWAHPIYADELDVTEKYSISSGSSTAANTVVYCGNCGLWYPSNDADHADGDTHASTIYIPYRNESDTNKTGVEFHKSCVSRLQAAKEAVAAFITKVKEMSKGPDNMYGTEDDVKHRVAIIGFGGDDTGDAKVGVADYQTITGRTKGKYTSTGIYSLYEEKTDDGFGYYTSTNSYNNFESYYIIKPAKDVEPEIAVKCYKNALRDVTNAIEYMVLEEGIRELNYNYGTYINHASIMAEKIFENTYVPDDGRNRVAVFFTDGQPDGDSEGTYDLADESIQPMYRVKNHTGYNATVYSIGIFAKADASKIWHLTDDNANQDEYMHMLSSNYPLSYTFESARRMRDVGTTTNRKVTINDVNPTLLTTDAEGNTIVDTSKGGYYLTANNASNLVNAFENIASSSTQGGADAGQLTEETVMKDIISDNFKISAVREISAWTVEYIGAETWSETIKDEYFPTVTSNTVEVTGFDYSENWVGTETTEAGVTYRGQKLVLQIPIEVSSSNIGGIEQVTNASGSGIYLDEIEQKGFVSPRIDIPTTVQVEKVVEGNSAAQNKEFTFDFDYQKYQLNANEQIDYSGNDRKNGNYLKGTLIQGNWDDQLLSPSAEEEYIVSDVVVDTNFILTETEDPDYKITKVEVSDANGNPVAAMIWESEDGASGKWVYTDYTVEEDPGESGEPDEGENATEDEGTTEDEEPDAEEEPIITRVSDNSFTIKVIAGMTVTVTNTAQNADLTITKKLAVDDYDEHQTFIFKVTCEEDSAFQMTVVINADDIKKNNGEFSVLIADLPIRTYIVEEDGNWSGRYDATAITDSDAATSTENGNSDGKVTLSNSTDNFVEFTNAREKKLWLDGNAYAQNIYVEITPKPEEENTGENGD